MNLKIGRRTGFSVCMSEAYTMKFHFLDHLVENVRIFEDWLWMYLLMDSLTLASSRHNDGRIEDVELVCRRQ